MAKNTYPQKRRFLNMGWFSAIVLGFFIVGFEHASAQTATQGLAWAPSINSQLETTEIGFKGSFRSRGFRGFGKFGGHRFGKFHNRGFHRFGKFKGHRFRGFRGHRSRRFH